LITIKKIVLKDGSIRYRASGVSVGKHPVTGRRAQRTITCRRRKDVEAELAKIGYQVSRGTYVRPWDGLVPELIDSYLKNGADDWEANTKVSYANALQPAREWFAHRKARSVTREHVEDFKRHLRASGRRRGGPAGTGLSARSVNLSLSQLQAVFDLAERDGKVAANPVRWVKRVKSEASDRATWSPDQVRRFLATAASDRLHAVWLLSALGLRRAEVCGLMWPDIDLTAGTLTIAHTRVLVNGRVIEKCPKSKRSARTLPLFEPVPGTLRALRKRQLEEKLAAGPAYTDSSYVAVDELGAPLNPERYSDEFGRLCAVAGVPAIWLHDTRATVNGILEQAGISENLRSSWLGHTVAVNKASYLRPAADLAPVSDAIGEIFRAV
jgi:integrase